MGRSDVVKGDVNSMAMAFLHLLASQISLRVINFGLNLLIARHLSPEAFGLSTVRFHLLITTIMMLSREGIRKGCQRFKSDEGKQRGVSRVDPWRVLSVAGLVVPLGILVAVCVCTAAIWLHSPAADAIPAYEKAVVIHGVAAVVELLGEPFYILATVELQFGLRVVMDTLPLTVKALVTLACVAGWAGPTLASLPPALIFSIAQLSLAVASCLGYWVAGTRMLRTWSSGVGKEEHASHQRESNSGLDDPVRQEEDGGGDLGCGGELFGGKGEAGGLRGKHEEGGKEDRTPKPISNWGQRGGEEAEGVSKSAQVGSKGRYRGQKEVDVSSDEGASRKGKWELGLRSRRRLLQYGPAEREVLATSGIFAVQAAEKLVLAEGSKIAVASLASSYDQGVVGLVGNLGSLVVRTLFQPLEELSFAAFSRYRVGPADVEGLSQLVNVLGLLVKAMTLVGLVAVSFGPPHAHIVVWLVYGKRWAQTEAPAVLSVYCLYILLLAVNGVTEAFTHAVLDHAALAASNVAMILFALLHVLACFAFISTMGNRGLILADGLAMLLRICLSSWYIKSHFKLVPGLSLSHFLLRPITLAAFAAMHAALSVAQVVVAPKTLLTEGPQSLDSYCAAAFGIAMGLLGLAIVGLIVWRTERQSVAGLKALVQSKGKSREEKRTSQKMD
ncbi:Rft protein-domain-containing protein [Dunaliella salina]|uniref:Protein RFT1 homolog n=1 Tax=Dunaliella salina TaxID=3046 RepID=A0ABQ7GNG0_DUNSA|nr:Rft protein-domain-containing protein [Dunaliella salina]|eukprot:KAF5836137.1 Rft protein-domain-containing protein [Dunaliella salina]